MHNALALSSILYLGYCNTLLHTFFVICDQAKHSLRSGQAMHGTGLRDGILSGRETNSAAGSLITYVGCYVRGIPVLLLISFVACQIANRDFDPLHSILCLEAEP